VRVASHGDNDINAIKPNAHTKIKAASKKREGAGGWLDCMFVLNHIGQQMVLTTA
jgi:hypothetical protein